MGILKNKGSYLTNFVIYCFKIAHFKIPRYVQFMTEFPKTVTGKIKKNILAEIVQKKLQL
jgi:fatty-acyl-CoA synthase